MAPRPNQRDSCNKPPILSGSGLLFLSTAREPNSISHDGYGIAFADDVTTEFQITHDLANHLA